MSGAERGNPDGVCRTHTGSKPTARKAQIPSGSRKDREANAGIAERRGETITRRIGPYGPTRKGADAILVSRPKYGVKEANLKVKVRCKHKA